MTARDGLGAYFWDAGVVLAGVGALPPEVALPSLLGGACPRGPLGGPP